MKDVIVAICAPTQICKNESNWKAPPTAALAYTSAG